MIERKELIKNVLMIFCAIILLGFLGGFISAILDLGETAGIFLRTAGVLLLFFLGMKLFSKYYTKPLTKEMEEEEIKEADKEDTRQSLFKPTTGVLVMYLLFISLPILDICTQLRDHKVDFGFTIVSIVFVIFWIWMWYITSVFIFAEDSVQIKSFLFYFFRIDRKTVIKYADITSVRPDPDFEGNYFGIDRRYRPEIYMNGTMKRNFLIFYNSDVVTKIYLRFKEKLGDKVKLD